MPVKCPSNHDRAQLAALGLAVEQDDARPIKDWQADVSRFNGAIGVRRGRVGEWPDTKDIWLATDLIDEEIAELRSAINQRDLAKTVDGIGDSIVVLLGLAHRLGVDMHPVMAEISRANLDKLGGPKRADGKQLKPEGWRPPDIEGVLRAQGWH